tara:strand:- start:1719 stop:2111 length:393 start_codon:yes stop_codon:yes gene_type:complete
MSLDKFSDMLKFGINLKLSGSDEDKYYAQRLRFYIMEMDEFDCESENDMDLKVYLLGEYMLNINIHDSVLTFEPQTEDSYDGIMAVLSFVATYHDVVQEDFKKSSNFREEDLSQQPPPIEEDSSDDCEWV